jgi:hypothetical protein
MAEYNGSLIVHTDGVTLKGRCIGQWPVDALPRPINRRSARYIGTYGGPVLVVKVPFNWLVRLSTSLTLSIALAGL